MSSVVAAALFAVGIAAGVAGVLAGSALLLIAAWCLIGLGYAIAPAQVGRHG